MGSGNKGRGWNKPKNPEKTYAQGIMRGILYGSIGTLAAVIAAGSIWISRGEGIDDFIMNDFNGDGKQDVYVGTTVGYGPLVFSRNILLSSHYDSQRKNWNYSLELVKNGSPEQENIFRIAAGKAPKPKIY